MKIISKAIIGLFLSFFVLGAYAEAKLAVVDIQYIIHNSPYAQEAAEILQKEFKPKEDQIKADIDLLAKMKQDFVDNQNDLSDIQLRTRERRILTLERDIKRAEADFQELLNLRKNEEMFKVQKIVVNAVKQIGEQEDFDIIFYDSITYFSKKMDISDKLLDLVKKQFDNEKQQK